METTPKTQLSTEEKKAALLKASETLKTLTVTVQHQEVVIDYLNDKVETYRKRASEIEVALNKSQSELSKVMAELKALKLKESANKASVIQPSN